ncbi:hypothetical protein ES703_70214 [subsurface metagenome]
MNDWQMRVAILKAAYNAAKKGESINVYEVSKGWGESKEKIDFNADYLHGKGWVIHDTMGGGMKITAKGIDEYERKYA